MVCNKLFLSRVVLWTRFRVSFYAYVDPLYELQVIYRALTRQLRQDDTLLLLNDQSGLVLGDSAVFSWAGSQTTGSLERSLLIFSTLGGLTADDLSCLFFTCTNTSQAATCTCNT
jgi:hypothetical protein